MRELNKELERKMQEEIQAWRDAGGDVDRLVMKALLAKVQDSGPNTAFKALASIEVWFDYDEMPRAIVDGAHPFGFLETG